MCIRDSAGIASSQNMNMSASMSASSNTWYTFPLQQTGNTSGESKCSTYEFLISSSNEKDNSIPVKLTVESHELNSEQGREEEQGAQKRIVIPDQFIQHI